MVWRIPIRFVDQAGNPASPNASNPSFAIPVMDVVFRYDPSEAMPLQAHEVSVIALVDTGADLNAGTKKLINAAGAPRMHDVTVHGATSGIASSRHVCQLLFPSAALQITTDIDTVPLRENGRCYDLIIGRLTLRLGKLVMDYPGNAFYWEVPKPNA
ncbi:pepsin/retropepsin-like aspartic protease family protein [Stenotrophomonas sp. C-A]|nr:hypothetical protein [Stenotrophomonas maltophilia]